MNVYGTEVDEAHLSQAYQNLGINFRASSFVSEAKRCGVNEKAAYRAVDRYLQKLRKAGAISFTTGDGMWSKAKQEYAAIRQGQAKEGESA